jgi:prepilin-type N-terminal cleavage/methylation domain-containing protein
MKRLQSGFTLVELLVVITIISILMGLLIPAINAAREVARRNQCATQVKNLALAAVQYENSKKTLPPYIARYGLFEGGVADPSDPSNYSGMVPRHVKVGGFGVALLPWLDGQPTYEHWTQDRYPVIADAAAGSLGKTTTVGASMAGDGFHTLAAPNLAIFQCPSNPVTDAENGRNSYISNNGLCHIRTAAAVADAAGSSGATAGATSFHIDAQTKANGTSMCQYVGVGTVPLKGGAGTPPAFGVGPKVTLDDCKDGQGFTALYAENVQALPWYLPGFLNGGGTAPNLIVTSGDDLDYATVNPADTTGPAGGELVRAKFSAGWVWHFEDEQYATLNGLATPPTSPAGDPVMDVFVRHKINGGGDTVSEDIFTLQMTAANSPDLARPSSAHVDGVNVGFADGATRFVAQSINYRVYQAIMTPRGKSSNVPWAEFVLTDELGE